MTARKVVTVHVPSPALPANGEPDASGPPAGGVRGGAATRKRVQKVSVPSCKPLWYAGGLRFGCLPGCRRCCGGAPGVVWITDEERAAVAAFLGLTPEAFELNYIRRVSNGRATLRERANGDCVLLDERGCAVYALRPRQCRDYPFWPEVVDSRETWAAEARRCPGIGTGVCHSAEHIGVLVEEQRACEAQARKLRD